MDPYFERFEGASSDCPNCGSSDVTHDNISGIDGCNDCVWDSTVTRIDQLPE